MNTQIQTKDLKPGMVTMTGETIHDVVSTHQSRQVWGNKKRMVKVEKVNGDLQWREWGTYTYINIRGGE